MGDKVKLTQEQVTDWEAADIAGRFVLLSDVNCPFAGHEIHRQATTLLASEQEAKKSFTTTLVAKELETLAKLKSCIVGNTISRKAILWRQMY